MGPRISVVMPVYNGGVMAIEGINSVLAQTYPAHEIIVIDDGSTDDTPRRLASFGDKIIMKRIPNSGPSGARNAGMKLATGDWIAFLDHDDLWFRNRLEAAVQAIQRWPGIGFVCCNYLVRYLHLGGKRVKHYSILKHPNQINFDAPLTTDPFGALIREHFIGTPSAVLIRRDVIEKAGYFNPTNVKAQDYEYWLVCALHTNIVVTKEPLFYKRLRKGNVSADGVGVMEAHLDSLQTASLFGADYIRKHGLQKAVSWAVSDNLFYLGNAYFEAGRAAEAFACYRRALKTHPSPGHALRFAWAASKKHFRQMTGLRFPHSVLPSWDGEKERRRAAGRLSFSVVIATMNRPDDLRAALNSISVQTLLPAQLIVVDQSTDEHSKKVTEEFRAIVARLPAGRAGISDVCYTYQEEKSLVKARNRGLGLATGDIVSFLDDDVVLEPDYYERIERCFVGDPEVGGVSGNARPANPASGFNWEMRKLIKRLFLISHFDGKMTASGFGYPIHENVISSTKQVEMLPGCNMNFRRDVIGDLRFDEWFSGYSYREDADFSYALSRRHPLLMIADAKLLHNYSLSNRLTDLDHKIMEIQNCRYVFHKYRPKNFVNDALFVYSLLGLALIDFLEYLKGFKDQKWQKFVTGVKASWKVMSR